MYNNKLAAKQTPTKNQKTQFQLLKRNRKQALNEIDHLMMTARGKR